MDKYSLLIFDVVLHYQLNAFKIPKMVCFYISSLTIAIAYIAYGKEKVGMEMLETFAYHTVGYSITFAHFTDQN